MSSIFIQIAAYHDYELSRTILDSIKKSSGENSINFGVHLCYYQNNNIKIPDLPNVKYEVSKAPENIGLGVGRLIAHSFYAGEDYYFQIDSHSRFDQDWDKKLISWVKEYQNAGFEKPLITNYPKNYSYEDMKVKLENSTTITVISFHENIKQFQEIMVPTQTAMGTSKENIFSKSVSGGCVFTLGSFIKPNPKIAFYGEEIFIAARAYTNGFDLLVPKETFMYHLYYNHDAPSKNLRRIVWEDFPKEFKEIDIESKKQIWNTFKENKVGDGYLGTMRTLEGFQTHTGLDFKNGLINKSS